MMKKYFILITAFSLFISCNESYDQSYSTYQEFEKANERNKAWFPKLLDNSCSEIKGRSNLSKNESIGKFNYKNSSSTDSVLSAKANTQRIGTNAFQIILVDMKMEMPDWFITKDKMIGKSIWKYDNFYLVKDTMNKVIYFLQK